MTCGDGTFNASLWKGRERKTPKKIIATLRPMKVVRLKEWKKKRKVLPGWRTKRKVLAGWRTKEE